jgi:hypothetical protein
MDERQGFSQSDPDFFDRWVQLVGSRVSNPVYACAGLKYLGLVP